MVTMLEEMNKFLLDSDVQLAMDWGKNRNIFRVLDIGETKHSKMLAWLLDPREGHLLKDYFLRSLLYETLRNKEGVKNNTFFEHWEAADLEGFSFNNAISFTELVIGPESKQKIDVAIIDPANEVAIFIENKTGSNENLDQTQEYFKKLNEHYKDFDQVFVFMDMYGKEAKDKNHWVSIDYTWLEQSIESLLHRNMLTSETEIILRSYKECIAEDGFENAFFQKSFSLLSKIAKTHKSFLNKLKKECEYFDLSMLSELEKYKALCVYKRHDIFFDCLFEYVGFEYYVEQASNALGVDIESELRNNSFYMHKKEWERYYREGYGFWGIQFCVKQKEDSDETKYNLTSKVRFDSFENNEVAKKLALLLQEGLNGRGRTDLLIASKQDICEQELVNEIKVEWGKVEKFIENYERKVCSESKKPQI